MKIKKVEINFTQVSNHPLYDDRLTWKAKGIFAYLYSKPDDWDFSSDRMKNDSSEGRKMLLGGLKELEDFGYLRRKRMPNGKMQYLLDYKPEFPEGTEAQKPKFLRSTKPQRHSASEAPISNIDNTTNTDKETNTDGESDNFYPSDFLSFWNLFPKKTGKGDALKAWKKIKPSDSLRKKIVASVQEHIDKDAQWSRDDGRFIPNPSTFLNQRRFDDEVIAGKLDTGASKNKYNGI